MERLLDELGRIQEVVLLHPSQGETGPPRTATILSTQTLPQQALVKNPSVWINYINGPVGKTERRE
jgi:hypothetical protein